MGARQGARDPRSLAIGRLLMTLVAAGAISGCLVREPAPSPEAPAASNAEPAASDAALASRIKSALHRAQYVDDIHVEVFVENGDVVLKGLVEDEHALIDVLDIARKAADGRKVINGLTIMKTSPR